MRDPVPCPSLSVDVRCYMQRFPDAKTYSAWLVSFDRQSLVVEVPPGDVPAVGERFLFQISGVEAAANFEGQLKTVEGTHLSFKILSRIQVRPPYENARVRTSLDGVVLAGDDTLQVCVADVSAGGLAVLSEQPLECGTAVTVFVETEYGEAQVDGHVRYCKPIRQDNWRYRIGLQAPA